MIPKIIHYCWFGRGEKPKLAQKCIASWRKFCPDYEIIEWNEDNFDVFRYPYAEFCLREKKYAFLSDFVRLVVVGAQGGIYFDTDVELVRSPDELLDYEAFFGFEIPTAVATGLGFGAEAGHPAVKAMMDEYLGLTLDENGAFPIVMCPALNTRALRSFGLQPDGSRQNVAGAEILPVEYFNPYDSLTGRLSKTKNTYSVHWYAGLWLSKGQHFRTLISKPLHRILGTDFFDRLRRK